jgi:hypothetical protein
MADDLDTFIKEKVEELANDVRYPRQTAEEVSQILHEKAEKTFLWAGIACSALIDVPSKDAVEKLSSLPQGLEELYKKLLDAALEFAQKEENLERITQIVNFVAISRRPSSGLPINESKAHALMANRCINFLQRTFRRGGKLESRHNEDRFLEYALLHWTQHASSAHNDFSVVRETESFCRIASKERETWLRRYRVMRPFERIPEGFSVFHVAARWGVAFLVHFALSEISGRDEMQSSRDNDRDIRRYDDSEFVAANRVTPLEEAARGGRTDIIHVLLENALPAMVIRTEVVVAAAANQQKSKASMELLLDRLGGQIRVTKGVIKAAAGNGNGREGKEVMAQLLGHLGRQIQIEHHELQTASWKGNIESVEQLLADGANAASANRCGWTPLHAASWNGDIQVVRLLSLKVPIPLPKVILAGRPWTRHLPMAALIPFDFFFHMTLTLPRTSLRYLLVTLESLVS